jgi:predicted GNAT superfamily acetyltransferase
MSSAQRRVSFDPLPAGGEPGADGIVIRRVETQAEYEECVRIQDETWGADFNERVPSTIFRVSQYLGGVTAAAFAPAPGGMLGFVFGMTGVQEGRLVHWSDLLAVRPEARDRGIGRRLKLFQRSLVLPLGVTRMLWTFDPLVARNAQLNLNGLGATVVEYVPDMYGVDTGSALHSAVGTDRFIVSWDLSTAPRVPANDHGLASPPPTRLVVNREDQVGQPPTVHPTDQFPEVYIAVPGDIQQVIAAAPDLARAWRDTTREAFLGYLQRGYRVSGFHRAEGRGFYRLTGEAQ